jgi:hypothetical protein
MIMPNQVSDEEFVHTFRNTCGSAKETAKILGIGERAAHRRRRSIERRSGQLLLSSVTNSPDSHIIELEFPDWQEAEIKNGLLVAFSDAHLYPGYKSTAHRALLKLCAELKPKIICDLGDIVDFSSISKHHRIGWDQHTWVKHELEYAADCLDEIKKTCKGAKTLRTMGNHDMRFGGWLSNLAPKFEGISGFKLEDHFCGWPVSWAIRVNTSELELTHRWKSGLHAPYNNTIQSGLSYATGHLHSQKVYPYTDSRILNGGQSDRWGCDVGTLSDIYSPYFRYLEAAPRNWRSGFAVFRFVSGRLRQPQLVRVVDEKRGVVEYLDRDIVV